MLFRSEPAETSKDDTERGEFAQRLARLGEVYVGDGLDRKSVV